jgi:hypothetical protein
MRDPATIDKLFGLNGQPNPLTSAACSWRKTKTADREDVSQSAALAVLRYLKNKPEASVANPYGLGYLVTKWEIRGEIRRQKRHSKLIAASDLPQTVEGETLLDMTPSRGRQEATEAAQEVKEALARIECPALRSVAAALASGFKLPKRIPEVREAKRLLVRELMRGRGLLKVKGRG